MHSHKLLLNDNVQMYIVIACVAYFFVHFALKIIVQALSAF